MRKITKYEWDEVLRYKYPRTYHLPYSEGCTNNDKMLENDSQFLGREIVITEKMDGENTTIYNNYYHARSIDSKHKDYHSWLLGYMKQFQYLIPDGYRICGEYLYAKHSIKYNNLESYFLAFSLWNDDVCLSWDDTQDFCNKVGIKTVPIWYKGIYDIDKTISIAKEVVNSGGEGIVVRNMDSFKYEDFQDNIAKYVRKNHVQTDKHWSLQQIEKNFAK